MFLYIRQSVSGYKLIIIQFCDSVFLCIMATTVLFLCIRVTQCDLRILIQHHIENKCFIQNASLHTKCHIPGLLTIAIILNAEYRWCMADMLHCAIQNKVISHKIWKDLLFSWQWCWLYKLSGVWHYVVQCAIPDALKDRSAFKMLGIICPVSQC
jgi:hypothetical protein